VRISTKKLRYALEIARDAGVAAATPLVKILKRHQERLGKLHDLQMLLKHVRETDGVGSRVNDLAAYADLLDRECRRLHADFVEHRAELAAVVKDVRHHVVPALTTPPRRQAHVAAAKRPARPRARRQ
jgi:CHAD domain-containing protein